jgi:hypothetical protein
LITAFSAGTADAARCGPDAALSTFRYATVCPLNHD